MVSKPVVVGSGIQLKHRLDMKHMINSFPHDSCVALSRTSTTLVAIDKTGTTVRAVIIEENFPEQNLVFYKKQKQKREQQLLSLD